MMARRLPFALASTVLVAFAAALTWDDLTTLSMSECLDQEAKSYPHLEEVAQEVMGSVGDQTLRGSFCEDAVEPGAWVLVSVYDWTSRKYARVHLRRAGIDVPHGESALTYRGVVISYHTSVDYRQNNGQRFVQVSFSGAIE